MARVNWMRILPTSHKSHQKYLTPNSMFPSYAHMHNHVLLHLYCLTESTSLPSEVGVKDITHDYVRVRLYQPPVFVKNRAADDPLKTLFAGLLGVTTENISVWGAQSGKAPTVEVAGGTAAGWGGWRGVKKLLLAKEKPSGVERVRRTFVRKTKGWESAEENLTRNTPAGKEKEQMNATETGTRRGEPS